MGENGNRGGNGGGNRGGNRGGSERAASMWRKQCPDCGEVKQVDLLRPERSEFYVSVGNKCNGRRGSLGLRADGPCKLCRRLRTKKRVAELKAADPVGYAQLRQQRDQAWRDRNREKVRRYNRESERRKRIRNGGVVYDDTPMVSIRPLVEWLATFFRLNADNMETVMRKNGIPDVRKVYRPYSIAAVVDMDPKTIEDWMRGRRLTTKIQLSKVDKILVFCGQEHLLHVLYPVTEEEGKENSEANLKGHAGIQEGRGGV